MRKLPIALATALLLVSLAAQSALATSQTVTLVASSKKLIYGETVTLSGTIDPAAAGESIDIRDGSEAVLATVTTDANGAFATDLKPEASLDLHAVWGSAASDPVHVGVRAIVSARLTSVRLFDTATVRGSVSPARPGSKVDVTLTHGGVAVATRHPVIGAAGGFATSFGIDSPGVYRARASFSDTDLLTGSAVRGPASPPLPSLDGGARGIFVQLLEQRLVRLHYRLTGVDERYDFRTADAVVAFRKVQGMQRVFSVNAAVWRALADPRVPQPRANAKAFHLEVDQTRQVLYTVEGGEVTSISHVSTGKPSTPTHDGSFRVFRKVAALTGGGLYWPSYFDGLRALHGYVEVPTYAASHGCVRIPYWNAKWVYRHAPIGTRVIVYH
jgi:hypothetical protein